ncbi:methyltransferase type 12 [Dietzia sp. UCD-THP]|uniref:class I SAM-dependent methyltransferase n=1 Tax=Dietzia sp. UCD-THP TaxID=1292020 RepID=UPI00035CCA8C|nr:class I SAM-dependent methyltransferase [Dietzia sp. UCD-THP]EYT64918.1 methyltransferase type 12 [Dietzia sp. UCD-THP]
MSTPGHYFESMYADSSDPWDFATAWYELRRYGLVVASLPEQRYRVCFEPACSVGVLTEMLAARCDEVHAVDVVDTAAEQARTRLADAGLDHAHVRTADALDPWPRASCDLLVLSEFLYYTPEDELDGLITDLLRLAEPGGTVVACHWLGRSSDHACTGEQVHAALERSTLTLLAHHREKDFLLQTFRR